MQGNTNINARNSYLGQAEGVASHNNSECGCARLDFMALATLKDAGFAG
jgi:hypothetical protein